MSPVARVLVVEDSETQALALKSLLERQGYAVQTAPSAEAALERLNHSLPDVVVADFHLPGMDGRELSRQIRLNGRTRSLPVLMLTSAREADLERQGLESGVDAYVPKSAGVEVMLVRLRALLRRRAPAPPIEPGGWFHRARVLVAHDSQTMRVRLRHLLEQEGIEVIEAAGPEAAMARLDEAPDCVILPVSGAGFDGFELLRRLEERRKRASSPYQVVAIGPGPDQPAELAAAFNAGADEVASMEEREDVVRVRIRAVMRRKLLLDESRRAQAAEARAVLADELARTNAELQAANHQLGEAQTQLTQSAKMASLGELVAGIAHEINNPLAFILGHQDTIERLAQEVQGDRGLTPQGSAAIQKLQERLASMRMGLQRIQALVVNLRKFSRFEESEAQVIDVPDGIETVLALLGHKLRKIQVRREFGARSNLQGSPAILNQAVMNIVSNAADAMGESGTIEILTREQAGRYRLEISDDGPGVPPELRDRIFEPFVTTKPVGSGTGLGLAIAYNVIRARSGTISVDESPLGGARFIIDLPLETPP